MERPGINVVRKADLLDVAQPLEIRMFHQIKEDPVGNTYEAVDGVVEDFMGFFHSIVTISGRLENKAQVLLFTNFVNSSLCESVNYMKLRHIPSGLSLSADIVLLAGKDYKFLDKSKDFEFAWRKEQENEVYKIYLLDNERDILGVMSLIDVPEEYRIHLNLIEVNKKQQGKTKEIDFVAGCLIAFAADIAFQRGYFGFVSLHPKTQLIEVYKKKYGFRQYGRFMGIEQVASDQLITKYLSNEEE